MSKAFDFVTMKQEEATEFVENLYKNAKYPHEFDFKTDAISIILKSAVFMRNEIQVAIKYGDKAHEQMLKHKLDALYNIAVSIKFAELTNMSYVEAEPA